VDIDGDRRSPFFTNVTLDETTMKKTLPLTALATSLALFMGTASAGPIAPVELKVIGTLDVPACTVTADNDGIYDYGDLSPTDIKPGNTVNPLASITKKWAIDCQGDTYLSFSVVDNADATESAKADQNFGLGNVNTDGKLGYFTVLMENATVDKAPSHVFATTSNSVANKGATTFVRKTGHTMGWAQTGSHTQQIGRVFETDMTVTATLAGSAAMNGPITDDVPLAGSLTLNFAYGL